MPMRFTRRPAVSACLTGPGRAFHPRIVSAGALALLLAGASPAHAQPLPPVGSDVFVFPGAFAEPASGASAGRALADRWLGDDVFGNPATPAKAWRLEGTPVLLRSSRQDLRARNTDFDETSAFIDFASFAIGGPLWTFGAAGLDGWAYAVRSVARSEQNAFVLGRGLDPLAAGATIESETSVRETAVGAAIGAGPDRLRIGVAGEWVMRDDAYRYLNESGAPASGERRTGFDGAAPAVRAGARWRSRDEGWGQLALGAAARWSGALGVEGTETFDLLTGAGETAVSAEREAAWEAGLSMAWHAGEELRLYAGAGGRTKRAWEGFGVTEGAAFEWSAAAEYRERAGPLSVRIGFGTESRGAGETDATRLGLGGGWNAGDGTFELGLLHRTLRRDGAPDSYEDRVVASVRWTL